jgi:hypothetical protein
MPVSNIVPLRGSCVAKFPKKIDSKYFRQKYLENISLDYIKMATSQQRFYQNNREKVLANKKKYYAKKSNKDVNDLFKNVQLNGKTKRESNKIIKNAIASDAIIIKYTAPDAQHLFDEFGLRPNTHWTPKDWIICQRSPIRIDQKLITVDYRENSSYHFKSDPQDREVLEITFEPWMLVKPMMAEDL